MTQVEAFALTRNANTFREGVGAFRNARDWAQEQRDMFISAANERAKSTNPEPTRTEQMTYSDWLATLDEAQSSESGHAYTAPLTSLQSFDSSTYYGPSNTYPVQESESSNGAHTESTTFDSSTYYGPSNTYPVQESESSNGTRTESTTFDSSTYCGPSSTYYAQESETSADELALDAYATSKRHRQSTRTVSKRRYRKK
jgi:hypothetical protein